MNKVIEKAGAILLRENNSSKEILLEYRDREYHDWSFPKGGIEPNETAEKAAIRELREETGYNIKILEKLPDICYEYKDKDGQYPVKQYMFLAEIIDGHLTPEFKSDKLKWLPIGEARETLTHQNLKDYLDNIEIKI